MVKITAANIPASAGKTSLAPATGKVAASPQRPSPQDSYRQNRAQAQVIDAEYVEFYSPSPAQLRQERRELDSTIEPAEKAAAETTSPQQASTSNRYRLQPHEAPPPGSYIDTFA